MGKSLMENEMKLVDFLEEIKKRPVEEKVQTLSTVVEKLIQIVLNLTEDIDKNLNFFKTEIGTSKKEIGTLKIIISSLGTEISILKKEKVSQKELKSPPSPPLNSSQPEKLSSSTLPPPKFEKINLPSTRSAIMGELKELFRKKVENR